MNRHCRRSSSAVPQTPVMRVAIVCAAFCCCAIFAAEQPAPPSEFSVLSDEILAIFQRSGAILWALAALLVVGTAVGIERLVSLSPAKHVPREFERDLAHMADHKGMDAGISLCREKPSALARVLQAALTRHGAPLAQLERVIVHATQLEEYALLRRTRVLGWLAAIVPIVGFLGFVLNISKHMNNDAAPGFERSAAALLAGVADGLPCLALAAIASLIFLGFFFIARARARDIANEIEIKGVETVLTLDRKARQSIRLIEDIEEKIKTESMIKVPDLSAEFDERSKQDESAIKTAVTTHAGIPVRESGGDLAKQPENESGRQTEKEAGREGEGETGSA